MMDMAIGIIIGVSFNEVINVLAKKNNAALIIDDR